MNLPVGRHQRSSWVSVHPVLKTYFSGIPDNRISELNINTNIFSNICSAIWITKCIYLYDPVPIVKNIKLNMCKKVIIWFSSTRSPPILFKFPNEPPEWKIIQVKLEVKVTVYSSLKGCNLINCKLILAQGLINLVHPELELVQSIAQTVTIENFPKGLFLSDNWVCEKHNLFFFTIKVVPNSNPTII